MTDRPASWRMPTPTQMEKMASLGHSPTTAVHDLASRLRCSKCAKAGRRPAATLLQLAARARQAAPET